MAYLAPCPQSVVGYLVVFFVVVQVRDGQDHADRLHILPVGIFSLGILFATEPHTAKLVPAIFILDLEFGSPNDLIVFKSTLLAAIASSGHDPGTGFTQPVGRVSGVVNRHGSD